VISRHSDEWKRVIATAALAGVKLKQCDGYLRIWRAFLPAPINACIEATSKYEVALKALRIMGDKNGV